MLLFLGYAVVSLGATIGPLGGSYLCQVVGPQAPFYANGIIPALCALVLWAFLRLPARSAAPA